MPHLALLAADSDQLAQKQHIRPAWHRQCSSAAARPAGVPRAAAVAGYIRDDSNICKLHRLSPSGNPAQITSIVQCGVGRRI
jgi:hypothetical protein